MFDQIYGIGLLEGEILCEEKSLETAATGAPVSNSFTLQQQFVFRDKNEAGMQCDAWICYCDVSLVCRPGDDRGRWGIPFWRHSIDNPIDTCVTQWSNKIYISIIQVTFPLFFWMLLAVWKINPRGTVWSCFWPPRTSSRRAKRDWKLTLVSRIGRNSCTLQKACCRRLSQAPEKRRLWSRTNLTIDYSLILLDVFDITCRMM